MRSRSLIRGMRRASALAVGAAIATSLASCGSTRIERETTVVRTVTEETSSSVSAQATQRHSARARRDVGTTSRAAAAYTRCDPNIRAKAATTTCGFAENAFYEYWASDGAASISVYSRATGTTFETSCTSGEGQVVCTTTDGGVARFSEASVARYTDAEAARYARSGKLGPAGSTTAQRRSASPPASSAPSTASASPSDGPNPSNEIPNYPNGNGYAVQCADGMWSHSGGIQGACSGHGGVG